MKKMYLKPEMVEHKFAVNYSLMAGSLTEDADENGFQTGTLG